MKNESMRCHSVTERSRSNGYFALRESKLLLGVKVDLSPLLFEVLRSSGFKAAEPDFGVVDVFMRTLNLFIELF